MKLYQIGKNNTCVNHIYLIFDYFLCIQKMLYTIFYQVIKKKRGKWSFVADMCRENCMKRRVCRNYYKKVKNH